jgi:hydroxyethylthiazole kinase
MENEISLILERGKKAWNKMKEKRPLVYHISNFVAMPEQAHITLAIGASPVMALAPDEAEDMCSAADALLINIGTPSQEQLLTMKKALSVANKRRIPVLLDPVGYGATPFRNNIVNDLLKSGGFAVIKGNEGEITALAGVTGTVRGVDAANIDSKRVIDIVRDLSRRYDCVVIATGEEDFLSDGEKLFSVKGGSRTLRKITASGCMVGSVIASLLGAGEDTLVSSIAGLVAFKTAAERAEEKSEGPGSFRMHLFDELATLDGEDIVRKGIVRLWT